jgi:DNA-binding Lrp family transcriptional regulator
MAPVPLDALSRRLIDAFQSGFPLVPRPYAAIAEQLGVDEAAVLDRVRALKETGCLSRIGAVLPARRFGASTLAAMAVPPERLESVAALVGAYLEVNHNYEREHRFNLWFVVAAPSRERLDAVLTEIKERTGLDVLDLPLRDAFHIDLGFRLEWTSANRTGAS